MDVVSRASSSSGDNEDDDDFHFRFSDFGVSFLYSCSFEGIFGNPLSSGRVKASMWFCAEKS